MKLSVTDNFLNLINIANLYQKRTGLGLIHEGRKVRWRVGDILSFDIKTSIEEFSTFDAGYVMFTCGSFTSMASSLPVGSNVGRYTSIAPDVRILGFRHPIEAVSTSSVVFNFNRENVHPYFERYQLKFGSINKVAVPTPHNHLPIFIDHDVWIGSNVTLSGGIRIGTGAVIATGSLVLNDVEPYSIVAGIPAKHKKWRFDTQIIKELLQTQWWTMELGDMYKENLNFANPQSFLEKLNSSGNILKKYQPKVFYPFEYLLKDSGLGIESGFLYTVHCTLLQINLNTNRLFHEKSILQGAAPVRLIKSGEAYYLCVNDLYIKSISNSGIVEFGERPFPEIIELDGYSCLSIKISSFYLFANINGSIGLGKANNWGVFFAGSFFENSVLN